MVNSVQKAREQVDSLRKNSIRFEEKASKLKRNLRRVEGEVRAKWIEDVGGKDWR